MSSIDIHDLTVTFPGGTTGLADVNLHVEPEEFIALIGPSLWDIVSKDLHH